MEEFNVSLDKFDGPFHVLLHLIEVHDIDLYDIEISLLTDQFLKYIEDNAGTLQDLSEFLVLASKLLEIKSRMLLPNTTDFDDDVVLLEEDDPRLWLVETLTEYKRYRDISKKLLSFYEKNAGKYARDFSCYDRSKKSDMFKKSESIDPALLTEIFKSVLLSMPTVDTNRAKYFENLSFAKYNVEEVRENLFELIRDKKDLSFFEIISAHDELEFKITAFLAILELLKYEDIDAVQSEINGDIRLVYG